MEKDVVLISGGSKGLGLGLVKSYLEKGNSVSTFSRTSTEEVESLKNQYPKSFLFFECDIRDTVVLKRIVTDTEKHFGRISVLINNTGMVNEELIAQQSLDNIAELINVNLYGMISLTKLVTRRMILSGIGKIVNISSIVSISGYKGTAAYSATKSGINGFTRALARELGGKNITVNCVAPGYMETDLTKNMSKKHLMQIVRRTPLGRPGSIKDVIPLIEFLTSDAASFISGQIIVVDGGLTS